MSDYWCNRTIPQNRSVQNTQALVSTGCVAEQRLLVPVIDVPDVVEELEMFSWERAGAHLSGKIAVHLVKTNGIASSLH